MRKKQPKDRKPEPKPIADLVHVDLPFRIPQDFLRELFEFSPGGFVLLTVGSNGQPQIYSQFESMVAALGLQAFGQEYFNRMGEGLRNQLKLMQLNAPEDSEESDEV